MSQRSDISASIQTNFPDNASQFITPTRLRSEQGLFEQYSVLNEQTSSMTVLSASFALTASYAANATINTGSLVTTASFNAYTASTNTFTSSIQTQVNALRAATASYATTGSNTFNGTNTFTGSVNIQSASITFLTVDTIVSSSTIFSSGSNTLGDAAGDTQTLWGTVNLPTGPLQVTGSVSSTGGFTGSLQGTASVATNALTASTVSVASDNGNQNHKVIFTNSTSSNETLLYDPSGLDYNPNQNLLTTTASFAISASWAPFVATNTGSLLTTASVALNTITFTKGDASTFNITVDTGSAGGMNLGANTFTGSQTIASSSIYITPTGSTVQYVTESAVRGNLVFGNTNLAQSGSVQVTGSANLLLGIGVATTGQGGWNGNRNIIITTPQYSGSVPQINGLINLGNYIASGSGTGTNGISSTFANGGITVTNTSPNGSTTISTSNINATTAIRHAASGSTAGNGNLTISTSNLGGSLLINTTGSSTAAKTIAQSMFIGTANTASLEAATNSNLAGVAVIGSNLIISGTMAANSLSGSVFVGQFNETGSLADPSQIKFAVGAGITSGSRKTPFYVSGSGEVVIRPGGDNYGINIFQRSKAVINDGSVGAYTSSLTAATTATAVGCINAVINGAADAALAANAIDTVITGGTSQTAVATNNVTMVTTTPKRLNTMLGVFTATISGSDVCSMIASNDSFIANSLNSVVLGATNVRLQNTTGSVALDRDAAYTGSANYTLYTQNINTSGSVTVNGNLQYNVGSFFSTASQSGSANVSQSITYDTTDISNGVSIVSGSQIKLTNAGTYNIQFSAQIDRVAGSGTDTVNIWLKKNGTNVSNSAGAITISGGALAAKAIAAWNYVVSAAANDYYELVWQTTDSNIQLINAAATGNIPGIPSMILTVTQVR